MAKGSGGAGRASRGGSGGRATDGGPRGDVRIFSSGFAPGEDISQWAVSPKARAYRSAPPPPPKKKADPYDAILKERAKKGGLAYNLSQKYSLDKLLSMRAKATSKSRIAALDRAISMRADSMRKR